MRIASIIFSLFLMCGVILAQEEQMSPLKPKVKINFTSCEANNSELSILNQYTPDNEIVIIISHLRKDEKKQYGRRRLHNAKIFLTRGFRKEFNRLQEYVLTAEGEEVKKQGYLDFYVKGKIELRIFFKRNIDLIVSPCVLQFPEEKPCETDYEKLFYPCKSKNK